MTHITDPRIVNFDPGKVSTPAAPRPKRRPTVREVMDPAVVTLPPDAHLLEAAHHLVSRGIDEVVIVIDRRPLGVITQRDLVRCWPSEPAALAHRHVESLLSERTRRVLPDLDIATAAAVLGTEHVDAVPVVDRYGDLVGVLAARHVLALVAADEPLATP